MDPSLNLKCSFVAVETADNILLDGLWFAPDSFDTAIVQVHGYTGNFYENVMIRYLARTLIQRGFAFSSGNNRGRDAISRSLTTDDRGEVDGGACWDRFVDCAIDVDAWVQFALAQGASRIVLHGHSLGASKAVHAYLTNRWPQVVGIVLSAPADMVGTRRQRDPQLVESAQRLVAEGRGMQLLDVWPNDWTPSTAASFADIATAGPPMNIINPTNPDEPSRLAEVDVPMMAYMGSADETAGMDVAAALAELQRKVNDATTFDTHVLDGADHCFTSHGDVIAALVADWVAALN